MNEMNPAKVWLQTFLHEEDCILVSDVLKAARESGAPDDDVVAELLSQGFRARDGKWLIWPEEWQ
jgi:hypothetical protein